MGADTEAGAESGWAHSRFGGAVAQRTTVKMKRQSVRNVLCMTAFLGSKRRGVLISRTAIQFVFDHSNPFCKGQNIMHPSYFQAVDAYSRNIVNPKKFSEL